MPGEKPGRGFYINSGEGNIPTPEIPTISNIEQISSNPDQVLRNLQITQCYYDLGQVLAQRMGGSANWCTFATWASKQAGQTIRKEDLGRSLEIALGSDENVRGAAQKLSAAIDRLGRQLNIQELLQLIWKAYDARAVFEHSSAAVGRGNLKVFAEIGREFARFYAECLPDEAFKRESIERFIGPLRPGEPPEGQRYLRQAFQHYYQALFETDEQAKCQLLLLANLEIGFHEQTRLQPEIVEALVAPVIPPQIFARNLFKALRPEPDWRAEVAWFFLRVFGRLVKFDTAIAAYLAGAQRQTQFVVTESLMTIEVPPRRRIMLGEDLSGTYPAYLQEIKNPDLRGLLAEIDPTPDSLADSGANYWGDLADRIHFIADLFRRYALATELQAAPFDPEQTSVIKEGRLPTGRL